MDRLKIYAGTFIRDPGFALRRLDVVTTGFGGYLDTFVRQDYLWLFNRIRPNTTVIDIGACIGDTAIYFAMHPNVVKVYSFEPIPKAYDALKEIISRSPLRSKITARNEAISDANGAHYVSLSRHIDSGYAFTGSKDRNGRRITCRSLNSVLAGKRNMAIKCDCEGAEKTMFDNADLSNVYALEVESHYCEKEVVSALRSHGFKVKVRQLDHMLSLIYAWKD